MFVFVYYIIAMNTTGIKKFVFVCYLIALYSTGTSTKKIVFVLFFYRHVKYRYWIQKDRFLFLFYP